MVFHFSLQNDSRNPRNVGKSTRKRANSKTTWDISFKFSPLFFIMFSISTQAYFVYQMHNACYLVKLLIKKNMRNSEWMGLSACLYTASVPITLSSSFALSLAYEERTRDAPKCENKRMVLSGLHATEATHFFVCVWFFLCVCFFFKKKRKYKKLK